MEGERIEGLYHHGFQAGDYIISIVSSPDLLRELSRLLAPSEGFTPEVRDTIAKGTFLNFADNVLVRRPLRLARFLKGVKDNYITMLFSHGSEDPWMYQKAGDIGYNMQNTVDAWDRPIMINSCNPCGVKLRDGDSPVLYAGQEINFVDGFERVNYAGPDYSIENPEEMLKRFVDGLSELQGDGMSARWRAIVPPERRAWALEQISARVEFEADLEKTLSEFGISY